mmetsp:Transcript_37262/g.61283  ORF Transcript_37262/g.61283 Transcript_37262/m.61283 type:complete len:210 (+) Transcript_37262:1449-2078(+)
MTALQQTKINLFCKPRMMLNLIKIRQSIAWILRHQSFQQRACQWIEMAIRIFRLNLDHILVQFVDRAMSMPSRVLIIIIAMIAIVLVVAGAQLIRFTSRQEAINHDTDTKKIGAHTIALLQAHFRCGIARRTCVAANFGVTAYRQSEVRDFAVSRAVEQDILQFNIAINDAFAVNVLQTQQDLSGIKTRSLDIKFALLVEMEFHIAANH